MTDTFETRPDAVHRYGTLVLAGLLLVGGVIDLATAIDAKITAFTFGGAALARVVGWWKLSLRLVVSDDGLRVGSTQLGWEQIASYRYRDVSDPWEPSSPGDLLVWPFVLLWRWLVYRPLRAIVRWIWFRHRDRRFRDAELVLLDLAGEKLAVIEGADGYRDVAEALDRIIARLHARPLPPFTVAGLELDAVREIEVQPTTTIARTIRGETTHATSEIPNLFLVLDAIASRGGRVQIDSDVFVPRLLETRLAAARG